MNWFLRIFGIKRAGGLIGRFGLSKWWYSTFSDEERKVIRQVTANSSFSKLDRGDASGLLYSKGGFLCVLTSCFSRKDRRPIGRRIALEAERNLASVKETVNLHFAIHDLVEFWYACRHDFTDAREAAMRTCRAQVQIARSVKKALRSEDRKLGGPHDDVGHAGYDRLCMMLKEEGQTVEAAEVAKDAKRYWGGNWDRFIHPEKPKKKTHQ